MQVEAKRLAFEDRAKFYADQDFYKPHRSSG
jgi:gamma-glutamyltranspeptidase